ncbi:MAG TPA: NAD-dependent epimerase, partial [Achromobacter sp.]|nr:NAD-dependent epimerase [Achromobacter sp.]
MKILITGGAGFLGQRLARKLLEQGTLTLDANGPQAITRIDLLDVVKTDAFTDPRVHSQVGDIADPAVLRQAIDTDTRAVFHLAAIVSGQAEADFDLGMRINLDASRALLEVCRALGHQPRVVFTSSVAVYGGDLPDTVRDDTALNPQSSYGTQKAIAELLLAD